MKTLVRTTLILALALISFAGVSQNKAKFGHVDSQQLMTSMPEYASYQTEIENHTKQLQEQLALMEEEVNAKYQLLIQQQDTLNESVVKYRAEEIDLMQQRIQQFKMTADQDIQTKSSELLQPIIDKARKAIEEVGAEHKFTYIYDISVGVILYHSEDSQDVLELVKVKLATIE